MTIAKTVKSKTKSFETRIVYIQTVPIRLSLKCYSNGRYLERISDIYGYRRGFIISVEDPKNDLFPVKMLSQLF